MQGEALRDKQCANTVKSYVDQWELSESMIEPRVPYSALPSLRGKGPVPTNSLYRLLCMQSVRGRFFKGAASGPDVRSAPLAEDASLATQCWHRIIAKLGTEADVLQFVPNMSTRHPRTRSPTSSA